MTCHELYERLTELKDGTLARADCDEVERHLADCPECRFVRQDLEDLARLCRQGAAATTMPADVRLRIQAMLVVDGPGLSGRPRG
jgi:predicted anti-sigma-YlaC factor YlaD